MEVQMFHEWIEMNVERFENEDKNFIKKMLQVLCLASTLLLYFVYCSQDRFISKRACSVN